MGVFYIDVVIVLFYIYVYKLSDITKTYNSTDEVAVKPLLYQLGKEICYSIQLVCKIRFSPLKRCSPLA